jgi:RNA polymerase sigma-70 factor (ECF subfamily)
MNDVTDSFEELRPRLFQVAYGILGSVAEAEEVIQDAWLRLERADRERIEDLGAWLKTVVARLSLDALRSARRRREAYVGEWLPEPLVGPLPGGEESAADRLSLDEAVAGALTLVLERLTPAERTAFLLHDTFGMPFADVAELVGRTPDAVRQLAARARRNVTDAGSRFQVGREEQERIVIAFAGACATGDLRQLLGLLDPDVVFRSDGGGRVIASRRPIRGAERVARALIALAKRQRSLPERSGRLASVNGRVGLVAHAGEATTVMSFTLEGGRIAAIDSIRNPEKLAHLKEIL